MTDKMRSYVKGLILGLCGKPLPFSTKKEPVAYLYNGVRLPDINTVWTDKEKYPYAFVVDSADIYGEVIREVVLHGKKADVVMWAANAMITEREVPVVRYRLSADGKELQFYSETDTGGTGFICNASGVAWSNYDIYYAEDYSDETLAGTLYLAASDPIPVYD